MDDVTWEFQRSVNKNLNKKSNGQTRHLYFDWSTWPPHISILWFTFLFTSYPQVCFIFFFTMYSPTADMEFILASAVEFVNQSMNKIITPLFSCATPRMRSVPPRIPQAPQTPEKPARALHDEVVLWTPVRTPVPPMRNLGPPEHPWTPEVFSESEEEEVYVALDMTPVVPRESQQLEQEQQEEQQQPRSEFSRARRSLIPDFDAVLASLQSAAQAVQVAQDAIVEQQDVVKQWEKEQEALTEQAVLKNPDMEKFIRAHHAMLLSGPVVEEEEEEPQFSLGKRLPDSPLSSPSPKKHRVVPGQSLF